ncbi:SSI family serine proteinase inhibitor [Streptomyces sp. NPDC059785]|uniref:SSI family serine proteinase inhibitor n=1 Tax=Streptomyces sp. NPDC059785 TaxID=3346945 RepID=UPI0036464DD6
MPLETGRRIGRRVNRRIGRRAGRRVERRVALAAVASVAALTSATSAACAASGAVPFAPGDSHAAPGTVLPADGSFSVPLAPPSVPAGGGGDRLRVTVRHAGDADGTYELACHPDGGDHPDVRGACDRLDRATRWGASPFAPVPEGRVCTMKYGGPATAHITGTWAGRPVDATYDRGDGCRISRWDALVPLLPDLSS